MKRVVLAAVVLAATASTASAGGFVGLGIGTAPATSGDVQMVEAGRSGRLELGYRFGRLSIEGMGSRADIARMDGAPFTWTTLGIAGKYNFPLGDKFEAFGRVGYQNTTVEQVDFPERFSGGGLLFGGGFEYRLNAIVASGSLFVDYTIEHSTLDRDADAVERGMTSRVWTLGATLGF